MSLRPGPSAYSLSYAVFRMTNSLPSLVSSTTALGFSRLVRAAALSAAAETPSSASKSVSPNSSSYACRASASLSNVFDGSALAAYVPTTSDSPSIVSVFAVCSSNSVSKPDCSFGSTSSNASGSSSTGLTLVSLLTFLARSSRACCTSTMVAVPPSGAKPRAAASAAAAFSAVVSSSETMLPSASVARATRVALP